MPNERLSNEEIARLWKLRQKATPGILIVQSWENPNALVVRVPGTGMGSMIAEYGPLAIYDANLHAAAVNAIEPALREIQSLRAEVERLTAAYSEVRKALCPEESVEGLLVMGHGELLAIAKDAAHAHDKLADVLSLEDRLAAVEQERGTLQEEVYNALYGKDVSVLGNGHCIKYRARHIELWHADPNCDVPKDAREIQELQEKTHNALVALSNKVLPDKATLGAEQPATQSGDVIP